MTQAIERARARWPMRIIEVECETIDQVIEARDVGVDVVLVDNMQPDQVAKAVEILEGTAKVEVSGRITLDSVGAYAETGADFISVGAITHSVPVLDIGLDIVETRARSRGSGPMLLTIDAGNTQTVVGLFQRPRPRRPLAHRDRRRPHIG